MDPSQLVHAHSSRSGEDLLFDLDDERHGHGTLSSMAPEPTTPSAGQVCTTFQFLQSSTGNAKSGLMPAHVLRVPVCTLQKPVLLFMCC